MASRLKCAWHIRALVAAAVLALPLFAVGSAQASIGGATPSNTNGLHADIRSATALTTSDEQVCFDQTLSQSSPVLSNYSLIYLTPYASDASDLTPTGVTLDSTNPDCVDLAFSTQGGTLDLNQFSIATALPDAVVGTVSGAEPNLEDSVTIGSSTGTEGTTGHTTGPNLVPDGVTGSGLPSSAPANSLAYDFDKNVDAGDVDPTTFWYENTDGDFCFSTAAYADGNIVIATFPKTSDATCADASNGTASVADAVRAGVYADSVFNVVDGDHSDETPNVNEGTEVSGAANGGQTEIEDLVKAQLDPTNADEVDYFFDHPIDAATVQAADFQVDLSDGTSYVGSSAAIGSGTDEVIVSFNGDVSSEDGDLDTVDEYAVEAGVDNGALETLNPGDDAVCGTEDNADLGDDSCDPTDTYTNDGPYFVNSPGAVPIGGNSGAFARGFTTGPDILSATINDSTDTATITFDQRVYDYDSLDDVEFLDDHGNVLASPTAITIPAFPQPEQETVGLSFDPSLVSLGPVQIELDSFCAFYTALENGDDCSEPQIVEATVTAAHLKGEAKRHRTTKKVKRTSKR